MPATATVVVARPGRPVRPAAARPTARAAHRRDVVVRRRRVAALVFTAAALFGAVRAVAAFGAGPASGSERRPPIHVVQPGETLWSIASALRPSGDVRALVRTLQRLNGGTALQVGQRLELPADG